MNLDMSKLTVPKHIDIEESGMSNIRINDERSGHTMYVSIFPTNDSIACINNVQDIGSIQIFKKMLDVAEYIVDECDYTSVVITVNDYFDHGNELEARGYVKKVEGRNPHSDNDIRFYVKEL